MDITQPEFIPVPWAANGQKVSIPEEQTSAGNGRASWKTGFPTENTLPISQGGVPANYQDFQGVLYSLSENVCYQQAGGMFTWSATIDYQNGARVLGSDGKAYISTGKTGPSTTVVNPVGDTSGKWILDANMAQVSSAASAITQDYVTSGGYTVSGDVTYGGNVTVSGTVNGGGVVHLVGNETISGTKTFASTISGNITGSASYATSAGQATKLTTARTVQTNLGDTTSASFDGTANITPGVTGTLAVANGGTGVTTIANIQAGKDGAGNTITSTYATKDDVAEEMATKADIDGNYPDMTVGNAEQLVSEDYLTDTAPYTFRTAGGNVDIGDREYDELVGGTIAWNQLQNDGDFKTIWVTQFGTSTLSDGVQTMTPDGSGTCQIFQRVSLVQGHKYLSSVWIKQSSAHTSIKLLGGQNTIYGKNSVATTDWQLLAYVWTGTVYAYNIIRDLRTSDYDSTQVKNAMVFDLTAMFGTAIADYIYALEQATAGAGVAWFRAHFPKDYYAYDPGSLQSVQAASHDMVGFNQWDEEWELGAINVDTGANVANSTMIRSTNYIPVFSNTTYYKSIPQNLLQLYYDADKNYLGYGSWGKNTTFTTPADCGYIRFYCDPAYGTTYHNDICVNLSWSGYRNGEYEPYEKHSYPLDSTLTLRGIPKLDASNNLYYDGDTYEADGTVTRRYGIVDLGTLGWFKQTNATYGDYFQANGVTPQALTASNAICGRYTNVGGGYNIINTSIDKAFGISNGTSSFTLRIRDSAYSDKYTFTAAMSGVCLVYELETPTTETADAFQSPQIVNDFGTEQYVDAAVAAGTRDVAIPVGHDTRYTQNLRDKLRRLPNMPDSEGLYLVRYDDRQCEFEEYVIPYSDATPQELGDATAGTSTNLSRADHVHKLPEQIGINAKNVTNIQSLLNGALSAPHTDSTAAYAKTIPAKAQPWASVDMIGGKTIAWNQLVAATTISIATTDTTEKEVGSFTGNPTHKYLIMWTQSATLTSNMRNTPVLRGQTSEYLYEGNGTNHNLAAGRYGWIVAPSAFTTGTWRLLYWGHSPNTDYSVTDFMAVDLTLLYGTGNEPATVDAFRAIFPASYYAYDAGTLISAGVTGAVSIGYNRLATQPVYSTNIAADALNTSTYTPVTNGTAYTFDIGSISGATSWRWAIKAFDINGNLIEDATTYTDITKVTSDMYLAWVTDMKAYRQPANGTRTTFTLTPHFDGWIKIFVRDGDTSSSTVVNNASLHLSSFTSATFLPYMTQTLPIPSAVQSLPGYGWSAGTAYNHIDWQRKVYVQNVGAVDMGTLNWVYSASWGAASVFSATNTSMKPCDADAVVNAVTARYVTMTRNAVYDSSSPALCLSGVSEWTAWTIRDTTYSDAATFKAAMNGVMLYYELATPVETDISSLLSDDNLLAVEPGGSISFPSSLGDDYRLPVPSDVEYTIDLAPDTPSTDGTYTLQCTVADGVATYSWVSA